MSTDGDTRPAAEQQEDLQELVLRRLQELGDAQGPLSAKRAVRGHEEYISYENLRRLARGVHGGKLSDRTAQGLSLVLRVPVDVVYRAMGVPKPEGRWELPDRFDRLNVRQRELLEMLGAALLDAYDQGRRDATGD